MMLLLLSLAYGCKGDGNVNKTSLSSFTKPDTVVLNQFKPKYDFRVNKKYDDKGNLVEMDSSYSYFYSSRGVQDSLLMDSLFERLRVPLLKNYNQLFEDKTDRIFFNDSLFKYDFYNDDYFRKRFEMNFIQFQNMYRQMDSLKSEMLLQTYPDGSVRRRKNKQKADQ